MVRRVVMMTGLVRMLGLLAGGIGRAQGSSMQGKPAKTTVKAAPANAPKATAEHPVNLNTATAADLRTLPNIGAATAARIIEYRQKNGSFKKIEDLMNVKGIGEKSFLRLKPFVTVAAKTEGL